MTTDKIYLILMCVWIVINILSILYNFARGKGTKRDLKQLFIDIVTLKGLISKKEDVIKGQIFPAEEVVNTLNKFEEIILTGEVNENYMTNIINYLQSIKDDYCIIGDKNDSSNST